MTYIPVNGRQRDPVRLQHCEPVQLRPFKVRRNIEVDLALRFSWLIRHKAPYHAAWTLLKLIPGFDDLMSNREQKKEGWESKVECI